MITNVQDENADKFCSSFMVSYDSWLIWYYFV